MIPGVLLIARTARDFPGWKYGWHGAFEAAATLAILLALWRWGRTRRALPRRERLGFDLEAFGLVLLFAALWLLCGVTALGIGGLTTASAPLIFAAAACLAAGFWLRSG